MKALIALAALCLTVGAAIAEQRTLYDASGRVTGRTSTDSQGSTTFYDPAGRLTGRSSTSSSGTTTIYDSKGRNVGKVTK